MGDRVAVTLRLWVTCPDCGRRPLDRITPGEKRLHDGLPPGWIARSVKCRCGTVYTITAAAYQHASVDGFTPDTVD